MYNFNYCLTFFNKIIIWLVTISLLSVSFSFNFDGKIKQELNTLCEATSISDYYNTLTNLSYGIINKILESTNISLAEKVSQENNTEKEEEKSNTQNNLYFVKSTNEKEVTNSIKFNYYKFYLSDMLSVKNISFILSLNKIFLKFQNIGFIYIKNAFCYFARGNIDGILINNNIIKKSVLYNFIQGGFLFGE